ncbi:MAG: hypothetical protein U5N55_00350 [Cypionkella sp.]|nr:hypothetical protein [Cypionkella sp.]
MPTHAAVTRSFLGDLKAETTSSKLELPAQMLDQPPRISPVSKHFWDSVMLYVISVGKILLLLYDFYLRNMKNGESKLQHTIGEVLQKTICPTQHG